MTGRTWKSARARALAALALVVPAAAVLSGCSPCVVGTLGIAKDAAGNLVVLSDACGEELDFMTFSLTRDGGPIATAANGQLSYDSRDLGTFQLSDQERQLTVIGQVADLQADGQYRVGAWDDAQSVSAGPVGFRADEITALPVGQVFGARVTGGRAARSDRTATAGAPGMTVDEWLAAPCADKR